MINRVLGWLAAIVAVGIIVVALLGWGDYTSLCF